MESTSHHEPNPSTNHNPTPPVPAALTLRPFTLSDAGALFTWASDPRVTRFQRRQPYTHLQQASDYILHHILPHPWYRAICVSNRPVGSVSVQPSTGPGCEHRASLGYRLGYDSWGKGIATRAVRQAVREVFTEWKGLERLEAVVDVENVASQRVLEKAGFVKEAVLRRYITLKGEVRDMVMYSLVRSDGLVPELKAWFLQQ